MFAKHRIRFTVVGVAALAAGTMAAVPAANAVTAGPVGGFSAAVLAQQLAEVPLDAIANAVGDQGRGAFADTYSNLYVDTARHRVTVYATNLTRAAQMVAAAKKADPAIDLSLVDVVQAKYAKAAIDAGIAKIMAGVNGQRAADVSIYSAAEAPDGSGILVTAKPSAISSTFKANLATATGTGIPVTVTAGQPGESLAWRWNDTIPFIGGDVVVGPARGGGRGACTTGLATEKGGRDYILTADHCFPSGSPAYGEGDATGTYNFTYGNHFGTVTATNDHWDAEAIDTGRSGGVGSNSDEADQPAGKWYAVTSEHYSYNGQSVCQDGARSYYTGHGVPCGIVVDNQDITWTETFDDGTTHSVRGVEGKKTAYVGIQGDSGGLVFTISSSTTRDGRGQVVYGIFGSTNYLRWTEAPDILGAFGMVLNPHT